MVVAQNEQVLLKTEATQLVVRHRRDGLGPKRGAHASSQVPLVPEVSLTDSLHLLGTAPVADAFVLTREMSTSKGELGPVGVLTPRSIPLTPVVLSCPS